MTQHDCAAGGPQGEALLTTALEALCERWRQQHPRCRGDVRTYHSSIGMRWRVENVADSTREIGFERGSALRAFDRAQIDGLLSGLWDSTMALYAPTLAGLAR